MLKFCSQPWDIVNISNDGSVGSCICYAWNHSKPMGNLLDNPLSEIINSSVAQKFKTSILDQSFSLCNPVLCPQLDNLQFVDNLQNIDVPQLPTTLALGIDSSCNLKCASCRNFQTYSTDVNPNAQLILDQLCKEYQNFNQPVYVYGDGSGDCFASAAWREFLNRDDLPNCFRFNLTTNGNLLTKNLDLIHKIKPQLHSVIVSLDAATADTYKKVRGGNFDLVLAGIRELVNLDIPVHTQFVLQYLNYQELNQYQQLTMSLGTATFGLQKLFRWPHMSNQWWLENQLENNKKIDQDLLLNSLRQVTADPRCLKGTGVDFFLKN